MDAVDMSCMKAAHLDGKLSVRGQITSLVYHWSAYNLHEFLSYSQSTVFY